MKFYLPIQTKIGQFYAVSHKGCLVQLAVQEEIADLEKMMPGYDVPVLQDVQAWMNAYNNGSALPLQKIPMKPEGTYFQRCVWKILMQIPYGCCSSYGAIAREVKEKMGVENMSAQAVGAAVGKNPIPILIPCHRVLGAKGALTGFRYGILNKSILLDHEGISYRY